MTLLTMQRAWHDLLEELQRFVKIKKLIVLRNAIDVGCFVDK